MGTQGSKVLIGGNHIPTNFNAMGEWEANIPVQPGAAYAVTIQHEDLNQFMTTTINILDLPAGQAIKISSVDSNATPVGLVEMKVYYPGGGLVDLVKTDGINGDEIIFILPDSYDILITPRGFQPVRLKTVVVANATPDFDAGGTQLASHTLNDYQGNPASAAKVFIRDMTETTIENSLVAARTTDGAGLWTANLVPAVPYKFMMQKATFESVIAEVETIG